MFAGEYMTFLLIFAFSLRLTLTLASLVCVNRAETQC